MEKCWVLSCAHMNFPHLHRALVSGSRPMNEKMPAEFIFLMKLWNGLCIIQTVYVQNKQHRSQN